MVTFGPPSSHYYCYYDKQVKLLALRMMQLTFRYRGAMNRKGICEISDFRREADENCALLGHYAGSSGNSLPTFRDSHCVISKKSAVLREGLSCYFLIVEDGDITQAVRLQCVVTKPGLNDGPFLAKFTVHKVAMRQVHLLLLLPPLPPLLLLLWRTLRTMK